MPVLNMKPVNAVDAPIASGGYAQAIEVRGTQRVLYISGQIPVDRHAAVPPAFSDQCRLVWANIEAQLRASDMSLDNLVKVTTFLSDRQWGDENGAVRRDILGPRTPALTVIITGIYDEAWLLEIEAIAVA
jgi:2-iminobutanoate/2-iminopropanoate deaminase